jgi:MIP family channel proteins
MSDALVKALVAEMVGTFALVFAGTGAIVSNALHGDALGDVGIALTFGLVIMVMIYATGHISGAHFNPAVTLAFALTRHLPARRVIPYLIAQVWGAIMGSLAVRFLIGSAGGLGVTHLSVALPEGVIIEGILTFILMFVIMAVATDNRAVGQAAAIAVGGTIAMLAMFAGLLTGASMNPARSLGPALVAGDYADLWVYFVGPILGAALGALTYRALRTPAEEENEEHINAHVAQGAQSEPGSHI